MSSRVAVAMSGGVDSSAAAALLAEAGHDVVGVTLQLWDYSGINLAAGKGRCCSPADIADARAVAAHLDMPHYVFDHTAEFRDEIVEPFLDEYTAGRTPSPCISCNRHVKFGLLWRMAEALGAEYLATGHYVRRDSDSDRPLIRKGRDADKDQSYFLFDVPSAMLARTLFPVGDLDKNEVRESARRLGLTIADKPESYELCFIPDGDKNAFVDLERPHDASSPIQIQDTAGHALASASGLHRYTIGQRRGLGLPGGHKRYVIDVEPDANAVIVGDEVDLYARGLRAQRCNWLAIDPPHDAFRAQVQIRHRHPHAEATVRPLEGGACTVEFDEAQRAVAPGQGVAFYADDLLLGGGWIESATR